MQRPVYEDSNQRTMSEKKTVLLDRDGRTKTMKNYPTISLARYYIIGVKSILFHAYILYIPRKMYTSA